MGVFHVFKIVQMVTNRKASQIQVSPFVRNKLILAFSEEQHFCWTCLWISLDCYIA